MDTPSLLQITSGYAPHPPVPADAQMSFGHGPVAPLVAADLADTPHARGGVVPLEDPLAWTLLKHAALVALAGSAVMVALGPRAATSAVLVFAVATAFLTLVTFVFADRIRFLDHARMADRMASALQGATGSAIAGHAPVASPRQGFAGHPAHLASVSQPFRITVT